MSPALALYRGAPAFDDWATQERERLHLMVVDALQGQVDRDLAGGAFRAGIEHAHRLLALDPLLEAGHRQMMLLLAASGQRGAALAQYESGDSVLALQVHPGGLGATQVAFSPGGTLLAAASDCQDDKGSEPLVKVWDLASGQALYTLTDLPERAWTLAFSPDGTKLVVPVNSDFFNVYDAASGEEVLSLTGHPGRLLVVAFGPDGSLLAAGSTEVAKLWDLATGQERATLAGHTEAVTGLAFSPDGKRLASSGRDGTTRVYAVDVDELVDLARSRLTRWFTPDECRQYLHMEACPPEP